jgi:hypothetical protein
MVSLYHMTHCATSSTFFNLFLELLLVQRFLSTCLLLLPSSGLHSSAPPAPPTRVRGGAPAAGPPLQTSSTVGSEKSPTPNSNLDRAPSSTLICYPTPLPPPHTASTTTALHDHLRLRSPTSSPPQCPLIRIPTALQSESPTTSSSRECGGMGP